MLRTVGSHHQDPRYQALEKELLEKLIKLVLVQLDMEGVPQRYLSILRLIQRTLLGCL